MNINGSRGMQTCKWCPILKSRLLGLWAYLPYFIFDHDNVVNANAINPIYMSGQIRYTEKKGSSDGYKRQRINHDGMQ
jgi:hypothetical protein